MRRYLRGLPGPPGAEGCPHAARRVPHTSYVVVPAERRLLCHCSAVWRTAFHIKRQNPKTQNP
eukprot:9470251-Pyramimonas_sp.AAC.1